MRASASVRLNAPDGTAHAVAARGQARAEDGRARAEARHRPGPVPGPHLGVLELHLEHPLAAMGEDFPELLAAIGRHLGLAIEKSRLEGEARKLAILEERNLIGNELHDSLAQSLIGMKLQARDALRVAREGQRRARAQYEARNLQRALAQANDDLRELLTNFRLRIGDSGLVPSVENLVERFRRETGIAVFFQNECQRARAHARAGDPGLLHHPGGAHEHPAPQPGDERAHHARQRGRPLHGADRGRRRRHGGGARRAAGRGTRGSPSCARGPSACPGSS